MVNYSAKDELFTSCRDTSLSPVSVIEIDNESVIKNIYRVYKTIYDVSLICRDTRVALPEPLKPEQNLLPCKKRLCDLLLQDVCLQRLTLLLYRPTAVW